MLVRYTGCMNYLLLLVVALIIWSAFGFFTARVEQAPFTLIRTTPEYEVREYAPHIEAQARVEGSYADALGQGFRIVAGYIFGGNTRKESIAMTAPVVARESSQKIAMTAPVIATSAATGTSHTIAFVMPAGSTLENLPVPSDTRVQLVAVPAQRMAVRRFSWYFTSARVESLQKQLLSDLARDGVAVVGEPSYAGYNPPWTPPWMLHNEVMVQIRE